MNTNLMQNMNQEPGVVTFDVDELRQLKKQNDAFFDGEMVKFKNLCEGLSLVELLKMQYLISNEFAEASVSYKHYAKEYTNVRRLYKSGNDTIMLDTGVDSYRQDLGARFIHAKSLFLKNEYLNMLILLKTQDYSKHTFLKNDYLNMLISFKAQYYSKLKLKVLKELSKF